MAAFSELGPCKMASLKNFQKEKDECLLIFVMFFKIADQEGLCQTKKSTLVFVQREKHVFVKLSRYE